MSPGQKLALVKVIYEAQKQPWWKRFLYFIMLKIWGYIVADAGK
jgi:hypothetical protein